jgi:hypothetical protein
VQWDEIDWGKLQEDCFLRNADRYDGGEHHDRYWSLHRENYPSVSAHRSRDDSDPRYKPRSVVVLRSWLGMSYSENDLHNIRAMIMELSLFSGAEYEIILLVDAHDISLPGFSDESGVEKLKQQYLPPEFHSLAVFFNNDILGDWYPDLSNHR